MAKYNNICFLDFETGSRNANTTQPTELGAVMIDPRSLEIFEDGEFSSLMKPILDDEEAKKKKLDPLEEEALRKTHITREMLENAPDTKIVWKEFCAWVNKFNYKDTIWTAPMVAGFNIFNFDLKIVERLAKPGVYGFGPWDKKECKCTLFHPLHSLDIMHDFLRWLELDESMYSISMDNLRPFLGLSTEGKHRALADCQDGAQILIKFIKLYRTMQKEVTFRGAFKSNDVETTD